MTSSSEKKQKFNKSASSVLPFFTIEDLIANSVHFGHKTSTWNHKMKPYIFGERNGIHIIDVRKTHSQLVTALYSIYNAVKSGKSVLFVSTRQGVRDIVRDYAIKCGQPYVTHRWLGGMLTNWRTIVISIKKIKKYEKILSEVDDKGRHSVYSKKELGVISKSLDKLKVYFDGLRTVTSRPDIVVVFDTNKDSIAIAEADSLCISSIGIADTNSSIERLEHVIPCNDDSRKAIKFIAGLFCDTILRAIKDYVSSYNIDINNDQKSSTKNLINLNQKSSKKKDTNNEKNTETNASFSTETRQIVENVAESDSEEAVLPTTSI
ncbi:30S ribosomal protein S2 [Candidatus Deianiraea vastatrix]|uniref:Small ribosomal subunit protein uS2 n=1 Tax=Candidatus Deianiraea vastatrix TaxID=2163644 RepID=A0A5B8XET0_9RICK|nr:30S ribosomal protein S2 [Candidatus Deianiraea vastatrix]QED23395.1 30S ribosomal protein S2 [Candidatus Deianiraea vastatrix]